MKIAARVEYDGSAYCGWQRLSHAPSVQEEIEKALSKLAAHPVEVVCAGRTDSGVHATGQIIHFESDAQRSTKAWLLGANTNLPDNISIHWVMNPVADDFHARFSALSRRYRYIILNRKARPALQQKRVYWVYNALDVGQMNQAAQYLLGENDFSSFRAAGCQARHAMREIKSLQVSRQGDYIHVDIVANAFLHHMVRNIVGSLIEVGQGNQPAEWFSTLLELKDRTRAGATAPSSGLYFVKADYPEEFGIPEAYDLPVFV
jgi:tRNA pseudouridine38-40 synthase